MWLFRLLLICLSMYWINFYLFVYMCFCMHKTLRRCKFTFLYVIVYKCVCICVKVSWELNGRPKHQYQRFTKIHKDTFQAVSVSVSHWELYIGKLLKKDLTYLVECPRIFILITFRITFGHTPRFTITTLFISGFK